MIDEASQSLADELVAAYGSFVRTRTEALGVDLAEALGAGEAWLREELTTELSRAYDQQRRGPLEIFQAAMSFPTDVLLAAGVEESSRDAMAVQALPGDRFDLAPASSREHQRRSLDSPPRLGCDKGRRHEGASWLRGRLALRRSARCRLRSRQCRARGPNRR